MHHVFRELQILNNSEIPLHTYWNGQIPKYWQHQMLVRLWNKRNWHLLLAEKQNGTATLGDSLAICYKTEHVLTIWSSSHTPWNLLKWVENLHLHKTLHINVFSYFFHKNMFIHKINFIVILFINLCQNLGAVEMSFSCWSIKNDISIEWNIIHC